jgi:hypothetical protein
VRDGGYRGSRAEGGGGISVRLGDTSAQAVDGAQGSSGVSRSQRQSARHLVLLQPALGVPCSSVMSFALLYSLVRFLLDALLTRRQSELRLGAEVLALRHHSGSSNARSAALAGSPPTASCSPP